MLALFPVQRHPLTAKYHHQWDIEKKIIDVNYSVKTSGRRTGNQLCHVKMSKPFARRNENTVPDETD